MKLDILNRYSAAQALAASGASTNVIDHGADRNLGIGEPMAVLIVVDVAPDQTTGDETYAAALQTDDNEAFGSAAQVGGTVAIPRTAKAGDHFVINLPPDQTIERYTRLNFTLGGTTPSITVTAYLVPLNFIEARVTYKDALTIS